MTALFAWLWQGLALTAAVEILQRLMPRLNAATRHVIWWAALGGVIALAAVHAGTEAFGALGGQWSQAGPAVVIGAAPILTLPAVPGWLLLSGFVAWIAAALHRLLRLSRGMRRLGPLRSSAVPIEANRASRLTLWSRSPRHRRRAELRATDEPLGACALGFRSPIILVSRGLLAALNDDALDQVVMHEQAHLDRFDDWLRLAQALATALACIHPAVHIIGRRIDLEREAACDDRVVSLTGAASRYAACLADVAAVTALRAPVAVPAALGGSTPSARSLRARVVRLLDPRADRGHRLARPATGAVVLLLAVVAGAAPRLAPLVAFVQSHAPSLASAAAPGWVPSPPTAEPLAALQSSSTATARATLRRRDAPAPGSDAHDRRGSQPPPAALPPTTLLEAGAPLELPATALGSLAVPMSVPPISGSIERPTPDRPEPSRADASIVGGVSQAGRKSATAAKRMALSVAGTAKRVGKAVGGIF